MQSLKWVSAVFSIVRVAARACDEVLDPIGFGDMNAAFQKDDALLADIATARARGVTRLWWLGQSGFLLHTPGKTLLFDPYLSDSLTKKYAGTDKPHTRITERVIGPERLDGIDLVTSSHNHTDHLDAETLVPMLARNPEARLLIPRANRAFVIERLASFVGPDLAGPRSVGPPATGFEQRLLEIDAGETIRHDRIELTAIPSAHNTVERDEQGRCRFLGYAAKLGSLTVFHSGDTLLHDDLIPMLQRVSPDVVLLPINGQRPERRVAGNLSGPEAARLAKAVGAKLVVPHHFDLFAFNTEPPEEFEAECRRLNQPFRTLRNGEGLEL